MMMMINLSVRTNFGHRSERGTQFVKWCTLHGYMVANTFSVETDQMWTYQNGIHRHQHDYIILSRNLAARFISCDVLSDVDIGSGTSPSASQIQHLKHQERKQNRKGSGAKTLNSRSDKVRHLPTVFIAQLQSHRHGH